MLSVCGVKFRDECSSSRGFQACHFFVFSGAALTKHLPEILHHLRIAKDGKSGSSLIFSERCRHACISRDDALRFAWSTPDGMHMTVEAETKESRTETARQNEQPECQAVFAGQVGEMAYGEMKQRLMDVAHISAATAKRRIKQWLSIGLIKPGSTACYLRT